MAGAGLRMAVSPTVMIRGDRTAHPEQQRYSTCPSPTSASTSASAACWAASRSTTATATASSTTATAAPTRRPAPRWTGAGARPTATPTACLTAWTAAPTTAPGAEVDATGCTQDSDGDNIADGLDRCPDTRVGRPGRPERLPTRQRWRRHSPTGSTAAPRRLKGATVDALGCPGDEDGDGVLDGLDRCPRTPTGTSINADRLRREPGAAPSAAPRRAPPPPHLDPSEPRRRERRRPVRRRQQRHPATDQPPERRKGASRPVSFLTSPSPPARPGWLPSSYVALDSLVQILVADPDSRIEVGAHTDNSGDAVGQTSHLTSLQADAVRNYLVTTGVPASSRS